MAINQLIAAGIQPPRFESPYNMMAQFAQIQQAQQANALNQMRMQQMERQMAQEEALAGALRSGRPLTLEQALMGGELGLRAIELQQRQALAQQKEQAQRLMPVASAMRGAVNRPFETSDESDTALMDTRRMLADLGYSGPEVDQRFASLALLGTPERRRAGLETMLSSIPGLSEALAARDKEAAALAKTEAETLKTRAEAGQVGKPTPRTPEQIQLDADRARQARAAAAVSEATLAGTLPASPGTLPEIVRLALLRDKLPPGDPNRAAYDARIAYLGSGSANTTAVIEDPTQPGRQIVVNPNVYAPGGGLGARGVLGTAAAQAGVSREEDKKATGRQTLGSILDQYESLYDSLQATGSIVSTERGAIPNIGSYIATTPLGQVAGQAVGSRAQSVRDQIRAMRTDLARQIMQATGMSAKNLDSNRELQLMLDSLADPATGYEAATSIIDRLRRTYVEGGAPPSRGSVGGEQTPTAAPPQTVRLRGATREELNAEVSKLPSGTIFIGPDGITRTKP